MKYFLLLFLLLPISFVSAKREVSIYTADTLPLLNESTLHIQASLSGFTTGESLLVKGVFFKDGSKNTFGYTKDGDSWIKQNDAINLQRQISVGEWNATVEIKPDVQDTGFSGSGEYLVKVGFYYLTQSGNRSPVQWSTNTLTVAILAPSPTVTPLPSQTPTKKYSPTLSPRPTITQTPTLSAKALVVSESQLNTDISSLHENDSQTDENSSTQIVEKTSSVSAIEVDNVLGDITNNSISPTIKIEKVGVKKSIYSFFSKFFAFLSFLLAFITAVSWFLIKRTIPNTDKP